MPRPLALLFALVTVAWLLGVSAAIASRSPVGILAALSAPWRPWAWVLP